MPQTFIATRGRSGETWRQILTGRHGAALVYSHRRSRVVASPCRYRAPAPGRAEQGGAGLTADWSSRKQTDHLLCTRAVPQVSSVRATCPPTHGVEAPGAGKHLALTTRAPTLSQQGGAGWLVEHLTLHSFDPFVFDGRDPAAFVWALYEMEARPAAGHSSD
jgi:hypothetical protein